jgi:hypothetical protein
MKNVMFALALISLSLSVKADDFLEIRSAHRGEYRYADWSHNFSNKVATDMYYIGVPENNEFDACVGYSLPTFLRLSVTPFFCGVVAKEEKEAGVKEAVSISFEKGKYKADAYYAHFTPLRGNVSSYDVLDAGNATRTFGKTWELGISTGFFRQEGTWNPLLGPLVRKNDKYGYWFTSYRFGPAKELRFGRTFNIKP